MSYKFEVASKQRYAALKNAFKTIDEFMSVSYTPAIFKAYTMVKKYLLKMYRVK